MNDTRRKSKKSITERTMKRAAGRPSERSAAKLPEEIEDSYELSPLQEGMLIHTLRDMGVGMYMSIAAYAFGDIDVAALEIAWQRVVERHSILRTSFHWENLERPQQVVHRHVEVTLDKHDWSERTSWEQELQLREFMRAERNRGFDLSQPPLLRLTLFRRAERSYYLVFTHHHLLLDGWSHPVLLAEIRAFYQAARSGHTLQLPPPRPFGDYIAWLRQQDVAQAEAFWRAYLRGVVAPTTLPADLGMRQRQRAQLRFDEWSMQLSAPQSAALQLAARTYRVTLTTLVQGAWAILLSRYSGQHDILFGLLVSGRPPTLAGVEAMIGMFLNTLPVRVTVRGDEPLRDWLQQLHRQQSELQQYEYSSLQMIQSWSELPRGTPLFESVVDINNTPQQGPPAPLAGRQERAEKVLPALIRQNFPLLLDVKTVAEELVITLTYDVRRFVAPAITQLSEQLRTLLVAMIEQPGARVADLSLSSDMEQVRVLVEWNQTQIPYPKELCLHQLFERRVVHTPDAPAVRAADQQLTYDALNRRSNRLAHHLRALGVGPGVLVGLCVDRSLQMVTGLLAILKAGGAYVPLDPNYPLARLRFMLQDSQTTFVLTQEKYLATFQDMAFQEGAPHTICLDRNEGAWAAQSPANPDVMPNPEELAYVLYTSGSTGVPKGVVVAHRVAVNRMHIEHDPFEPDEAICVKTSLSFVDSIWELFSAWHHGLCATLVSESHVRDPRLLVESLAAAGATRIVLVPSLLRALLGAKVHLAARLPRLKHWISSGEPLPSDLCAAFAEQLPHAILTNLYGTSEVWDATRCDSRERPGGQPIPIGRPMGNVRVYVLDDRLRPVPIGIPGELFVGGDGLARGYWRRPDLTAEKFIPDPFSGEPGQRLYKTNDLVRWLADGTIEYLGRRDHQLKLRGFRIELEEIESVLRQFAGIRQAAVALTTDEQLVAYVVTERGLAPQAGALRAFLRQQLPDYMIPAIFHALDKLPLTPSGKVDRRALLPPPHKDAPTAHLSETSTAPFGTATEERVARVWAEMLGVRELSADSDFFELGGHSLLAVRIASRLSHALEIQVPVASVLENRTIANLAAWLDRAKIDGFSDAQATIPELTRAERAKLAPLSFAQQRMWFLDQINPGSASYTVPNMIHFTEPLHVDTLRSALAAVVARHEALRTTFFVQEGEPYQRIHEPGEVEMAVIDLTTLPADEREDAARRLARQQAREPWDLERGPLYRARVYRLTATDHHLVVTMHHIITDGRSMGIFARELVAIYQAMHAQRPCHLPELPLQYADFAIWQRNWMQGEELNRQLIYWKEKLDGATVLELPTDRPRPPIHRYHGAQRSFQLPAEIAAQLSGIAQKEGATMFMVLLSAFQLLLARHSGQDDVTVGTPVANRNRVALENLVGFFVNTLVMRADFSRDLSFRALLQQVKATCLEAYAHQDLPFDKLVDTLQPQRDLSRHPLFQVMFVHHNTSGHTPSAPSIVSQPSATELETSNFDLLLVVNETNEAIECKFQYDTDLFEPETIDRFAAHFKYLIEQIISNRDRPLSQISLLSAAERRQILGGWSHTTVRLQKAQCIHELIEAQAQRRPHGAALRFDTQLLTYGEVERRSNQLARHLRRLEVGPEVIVGLCLPRSPELIIAMLAVLKAGGAFLPLDPANPPERLEYMLHDSKAALVLSQQHLRDALPATQRQLLFLDQAGAAIAQEDDRQLAGKANPSNLAYVIYTSGSTGRPKGVLVEHRSLTNVIRVQIAKFDLKPTSRVLQMLSISFDAALGEIFRTLAAGATLCLASQEDLLPGPSLIGLLRTQQITAVALSPTTLAALPAANGNLPALRTLTVGGEACPPEVATRWGTGRRMINGYGPTETTIGAILAVDWDLSRKAPLGRPLANVQVYVLDRWMQPVPVGTPGELYIGGVGVTRGYLNRPDLTAEKFVPNPFSKRASERLYRTGDLVRWLHDGNLDFLGRIDLQVKIRGFRVELSEIEAVLSQHEQVSQCVVTVCEEQGVRRIAAYITTRGPTPPSPTDIRAFLKLRLPDYMLPAFLTVLPMLPMTTSGKVDRNALPKPNADQLALKTNYVAPHTATEKVLARIWADVLGMERVSIHANFFELGGDSIMAIGVVARATQAGLRLTAKDLFQHQTIAELAQVTEASEEAESHQGVASGEVLLTPVQSWFFEQNPLEPHYFNQWIMIETPSNVDFRLLAQALRQVMEHHDALRLRYRHRQGSWQQFIAMPEEDAPAVDVDLATVSVEAQQHVIEARLAQYQASLDLTRGPLLRMVCFHLGPAQPVYLALIVHHLLIDLVSWPIVLADLMTVYQQLRGERTVRLPRKTISFKRWAEALHDYARGESLQSETPFWLDPRRFDVPPLPIDFVGENTKTSTQTVDVRLDEHATQILVQKMTRHYKTQMNNLLLSALALTLTRWTNSRHFLINIEGHGREEIGANLNISRTVGWFTLFYPLLLEIDPTQSLNAIVHSVLAQVQQVPNRGIGYGILRYLSPDSALRKRLKSIPEAQITLNYAGQQMTRPRTQAERDAANHGHMPRVLSSGNAMLNQVRLAESDQGLRRHLLGCGGGIVQGQLYLRWSYSSNVYRPDTVERIAEEVMNTLRAIADDGFVHSA